MVSRFYLLTLIHINDELKYSFFCLFYQSHAVESQLRNVELKYVDY